MCVHKLPIAPNTHKKKPTINKKPAPTDMYVSLINNHTRVRLIYQTIFLYSILIVVKIALVLMNILLGECIASAILLTVKIHLIKLIGKMS